MTKRHRHRLQGLTLAAALLVTASACASPSTPSADQTQQTRTARAQVDEPWADATLEELIAASDLTVLGRVSEVRERETYYEEVNQSDVDRIHTITIDEVLKGTSPGDRVEVPTVYSSGGTVLQIEGVPLLKEGDTVLAILEEITDPELDYTAVSTASLLRIEGDEVAAEGDSPAARQAVELGLQGVRDLTTD